jgi:hypothetical protein
MSHDRLVLACLGWMRKEEINRGGRNRHPVQPIASFGD